MSLLSDDWTVENLLLDKSLKKIVTAETKETTKSNRPMRTQMSLRACIGYIFSENEIKDTICIFIFFFISIMYYVFIKILVVKRVLDLT